MKKPAKNRAAENENDMFPLPARGEKAWRPDIPIPEPDDDSSGAVKALVERVKELNCMYGMAKLAEQFPDSIGDFLENLVNIIPPSWQYPEICCARIQFESNTYRSPGFKVTKWRQSAPVSLNKEIVGDVEVFYLEERPAEYEGPFLKEERLLLNAIARQISKIYMRIAAEKQLLELNRQLTVERKSLREANAALRGVMRRVEEEKSDVYRSIHANVERILMPVINAMAIECTGIQKEYVNILRTNLEEITSPFVHNLSKSFRALTPTEIKICRLIRGGMRTKEIARIQGVSGATINRHREHIRKKLGLVNRDINLTTYLQSEMWDEDGENEFVAGV